MIEPDFLARILPEVADIALVLSPVGMVMAALVNAQDAPIPSIDHWVGTSFSELLTEECVPKLERVLQHATAEGSVQRVELNHRETGVWQYPVRYSVHYSDHEGGAILLLGRDLRHVAETQQQLVQAQMALERGYEERREFDARYRMLMTVSREAFVLLDANGGLVRDINGAAALLLGEAREALRDKPLSSVFKGQKRSEFIADLSEIASTEAGPTATFTPKRSGQEVVIEPVSFRSGGERILICRLEPKGSERPANDHLSENLNLLFRGGPEAIVFTDRKGVIKQANDAFLRILHFAHHADVEGRSIADSFSRGQVDLNALLNNAEVDGGIKGYATRLVNDLGASTPVEVSACVLDAGANPTMALIFRDASRKEATRAPAETGHNMAHSNVVDLVGSASLKEIVSQTTDVIERMCIETAIELTGNNRAAAAEMLGLSRQSLYVKLNKFDIQDKSGRS